MDMTLATCREFVSVLASDAPAPGGGGAAALVGAIGTALGNMVGSLTVGKKKYADVQDEIIALKAKCDALQTELLNQVEMDEVNFLPLSKAYGLPKETEEEKAEKARIMEIALKDAVNSFLASLSNEHRIIFLRRYWYMSDVASIARDYRIPEGTVKSILSRTRNKFKKYLEKEGYKL